VQIYVKGLGAGIGKFTVAANREPLTNRVGARRFAFGIGCKLDSSIFKGGLRIEESNLTNRCSATPLSRVVALGQSRTNVALVGESGRALNSMLGGKSWRCMRGVFTATDSW
jgi:hypothetical protein